ncbi:GIY-YIG nuclease family protein [Streptomyces prasinus]|uniref:GIY-YIG nuclease family protein n=1 Tax=Streptomyces prasinus TaxID=67345 RepID=UPI00332F162C
MERQQKAPRRDVMSEPPKRDALYRLYTTNRKDGLPAFLAELYPPDLDARRYLGTAGSCKNGGPGLYYSPCDWVGEWCVALRLGIEWGQPKAPRKRPRRVAVDTPTALYRLRDKTGRLLYVGISDSPLRRWPEHAADKPWWSDVSDLSLEWLESRPAALAAEAHAIQTEKPLYNVLHNRDVAA